jgi:hypothetical protein
MQLDPEAGPSPMSALPVLGTLHRKALTDCTIPRGRPLRSNVEAKTAVAASYIVPWRTAVVKRDRWTTDLHKLFGIFDDISPVQS